ASQTPDDVDPVFRSVEGHAVTLPRASSRAAVPPLRARPHPWPYLESGRCAGSAGSSRLGRPAETETTAAIAAALAHRGPDGDGLYAGRVLPRLGAADRDRALSTRRRCDRHEGSPSSAAWRHSGRCLSRASRSDGVTTGSGARLRPRGDQSLSRRPLAGRSGTRFLRLYIDGTQAL